MAGSRSGYAIFFVPVAQESEPAWKPLADIYRTPYGWLVKFDLAGVRTGDVAVSVSGNQVSVAGIRRDCVLEEGCRHYSMEISYNRFERTVALPVVLEGALVEAEFRMGQLLVRLRTRG